MRTEITELATGLGMLGYDSPERALVRRPREFTDVDDDTWTRFVRTVDAPDHRIDFAGAHANGQAFLCSDDGLRGRRPLLIEWKGSHRAPTSDSAPVDLRIDHVFLVSCKYASKILLNAAPATLFAGGPAARDDTAASDWFTNVSPEAHQALYSEVRAELGDDRLPPFVADLAKHHRRILKEELSVEEWGSRCREAYRALALDAGVATAKKWRLALSTKRKQEAQLWRLLRIGDAPYYVLGAAKERSLRLRVTTPWDWRRRFEFRALEVWGEDAGQARVAWRATVRDHEAGGDRLVDGHVEVRWSHGRFAQAPEAKVYLDTPHQDVPGYLPLL
ncbi:MAG: hypothetical protein ACI8Y4_002730 [Candidatus Poriferisodalaceae bacterium]|jgi:hypothetical protein